MNNILVAYNIFIKIYKKKLFIRDKFKTYKEKNIEWSNQLFKDFINILVRNNTLISQSLINNKSKCRRLLQDIDNSFHYFENLNFNSLYYDFTRKIFLYKKLRKESRIINIVIPECGICGFDLFICKILGFKNFFCYDKDLNVKESIKKIWGLNNIKIYSMNSKNFSRIHFTKKKYLIIEPDWCSRELRNVFHKNNFFRLNKNLRVLRYSNSRNFKEHLNYINKSDVSNFYKTIVNHVLHS
jgi:hypothetical protein